MKHKWDLKSFTDIATTITPISKIEKSEYMASGLYPIISQEDVLVSGYWNEYEDLTPHSTPVVIFGDHTRVLKYVDFEFAVGADGVKIIQPKGNLNAKFLYHYLKWLNVPSLGYSRHFKLIKEAKYSVPQLNVQEQIVAELDKINEIISDCKEAIRNLDSLAQSLFYDYFGDHLANSKRWDVNTIGNVCLVQTGATPSRENPDYFNGNIPWIKTTEVQNCEIRITEEHISEDALKNTNCKVFPIDTIIVAMYGQGKTRGQIAKLKVEACTNQACAAILPSRFLDSTFLYWLLFNSYESLRNLAVGGNQKNLNLSIIKNYKIILPPVDLQKKFATRIEQIEQQKMDLEETIASMQTLLDSRMDYWFG